MTRSAELAVGPGVAVSVLDLAPVGEGYSAADALANSTELAGLCEALGFHRYWVAEHHNMPGIASSAPAVLIAHLAAHTSTLRLGSGGVMLPNHSPLVIAEQFGMLEALHPGRIDLGIGRAPGTDQGTMVALRRTFEAEGPHDFPRNLQELLAYFDGPVQGGPRIGSIEATPGRGFRPDVWLLGSSDFSAHLAGQMGLPFSFAHHFSGHDTDTAVATYRAAFRPSARWEQPYVMLGVNVVCAPTPDEATNLASSAALAMARLRSGRPGKYPTPEEALAHVFTPLETEVARGWGRNNIVGDPPAVVDGLRALAARTRADELMITTITHSHAARMRSYRLVAEALTGQPAPA